MANDELESVERWTAKRRVALIVSITKGETSIQEGARKHGLTVGEIEEWKERFFAAAENALRSRPKDDEAFKDRRACTRGWPEPQIGVGEQGPDAECLEAFSVVRGYEEGAWIHGGAPLPSIL